MLDQNPLLMSEERRQDFNLILNNLLQGIICINQNGIITTYNKTAEKILEKASEKVLNTSYTTHFQDDLFGFSINQILKEKIHSNLKYFSTYTSSEKKETPIELETIYRNGSSELIVLFRDVTEEKKTESLLHASDRLKDLGSMTAMLAHEIRNPLGGIKGFASLLKKDLENQPNLKQMVDFIIDGTDHLNHLVSHILNFAHPLNIKFHLIDLVVIIENIKQLLMNDKSLNSMLLSHQIKFEISKSKNQILCPLDEELMQSSLLNLLINAIQAMPNGGTLSIHLDQKKNYTEIQIKDTGTGISKENLKKIFTAFFTTKKTGNGFGLLEVYKVVEAHKGSIEVDSIVDQGTTFTIKLPNS